MSGRRRKGWVLMGPEPHFAHCTRCGGLEEKPDLPLPVDAVVAYVRYVVAKHKDCPKGSA